VRFTKPSWEAEIGSGTKACHIPAVKDEVSQVSPKHPEARGDRILNSEIVPHVVLATHAPIRAESHKVTTVACLRVRTLWHFGSTSGERSVHGSLPLATRCKGVTMSS
jgi:hypothetical protein